MEGRLIREFIEQTKNTILEYLDRLAVNNTVYSTLLKGYEPYLKENNIIIYLHDRSMVVLCFDLCGRIEEIADEGDIYDVDAPEYYSQKGSRKSPVWQLSETIKLMEDSTITMFPPIDIYGILLSESNILNASDMKEKWESMNIHVIDNLTGLRHRKISTNENYNQEARDIIDSIAIRGFRLKAPEYSGKNEIDEIKDDKDSDEFEILLMQFLEDDYEVVDEKEEPSDFDSLEPDVDDRECDNDINPDDFPKGSVHVIEDFSIPDGNIMQNDKISVKAEILRPISNPREELDKLVGCTDIKRRMDELVALTGYNKLMSKVFPNSKQHEVSLHSVFLGRPGTGKTTVCKIFGSLLRQAGALSKGHVVVCDRGTFILRG